MIAKIIKIGNSLGIRIPKTVLKQTGLKEEVELEVRGSNIILKPKKQNRSGWADFFRTMAKNGDDLLLDKEALPVQNSWDDKEWEW